MTNPGEVLATATLRNGLAVTIRNLRPDDRERIARAVRQLDRDSVYMRLFSYRDELTDSALDRIMRVDPQREVALVVTVRVGGEENVVGSGRYVVTHEDGDDRVAEVAFIVEEDYQGLGIASLLLRRLVRIARERGISAFEADVLAGNKSMLSVFERAGLTMIKRRDGGTTHVTFALRDLRAY